MPGSVSLEKSGQCDTCERRYRWEGEPLLRDALCPKCKTPLRRAFRFNRKPVLFIKPAIAILVLGMIFSGCTTTSYVAVGGGFGDWNSLDEDIDSSVDSSGLKVFSIRGGGYLDEDRIVSIEGQFEHAQGDLSIMGEISGEEIGVLPAESTTATVNVRVHPLGNRYYVDPYLVVGAGFTLADVALVGDEFIPVGRVGVGAQAYTGTQVRPWIEFGYVLPFEELDEERVVEVDTDYWSLQIGFAIEFGPEPKESKVY